jgi:NDP-sugar pyrophosphorylase family protein
MKAIILAGGLGRRLLPYTVMLPKPLMPLGEKPVLETVLNYLRGHGIEDVTLCIGHLGSLLRAYFGDGSGLGLRLRYSEEKSLLREELTETFLMMNGDVLSDLDLAAFGDLHRCQAHAATVAVCAREVAVDFGVIHLDGRDRITGLEEKPTLRYLVSAGIYLFEPRVLDLIPRHAFFDIPDLIRALCTRGESVGAYRHPGFWLDIGRPDDYEQACRDFVPPPR